MARNNDSGAPVRGARRRRPDNRHAKDNFEWGAVDDQVQEDLIEPIAVSKRKKSRVRRDEHVANTLYASNPNEDPYAPVKKKPVKTRRAEDYASFVAEVGDDEIDPYAIPSYGSTRLTHGDEEFVEELASSPERERRNRRKDAPADETVQAQPQPAQRVRAREEKNSRKVAVDSTEAVKSENAGGSKRSLLSKIKEAVATTSAGSGETFALSQKRLNELTAAAQKALDAAGVKSNGSLNRKGKSQLETLADVIEALLSANLAILGRVQSAQTEPDEKNDAAPRERQKVRAPKTTVVEEEDEETQETAQPKPSRQRSRNERRGDEETAPEAPVRKRSARQEESSDGKPERPSRKDAAKKVVDDYDDNDPFSFWENIEDEPEPEPVPAVKKRGARGSCSCADDTEASFDERDEAGAKKKSTRRERTKSRTDREELSDDVEESEAVEDAVPEKPNRRRNRRSSAEEPQFSASGTEESAGNDKSEPKALLKFGELKLRKPTLKALQAMGYSEPTPIQAGTIPTIQKGVDVMGQARTGTGKTAAFMIPIVEGVAACESSGAPLAVAVLPTRELAVQVRDETKKIARYYDLSVVACYGGKPLASQVEKLRQGVDILVGTPGRIIDLANRGALSLGSARWVVLDEADRMLDIGFRPDVERILRQTPRSRQTLLFSATLPPPVVSLARTYMKDPEQFDFSQKDVSAETIEQFYMTVDQDRKFDALTRLLEIQNPHQAIVFCRTKRHVDMVARRLAAKFPSVEAIHGDLPQSKRDHIMRDFRAEKIKTLVATDVVGRGIDVSTVSHIINYDIPQYCDDYVHRVGRAGRMGREGVAFTLVTAGEGAELTRVEIRINRLLERYEIPGFEAVSTPSEQPVKAERKPVFGHSRRRISRAL